MKIKQTRSKGIVLSYVYFIANTIFSILLSSFIIWRVGKTDYGVYQSMTAFVSYLILLEFGTSTLMARNLSLLKKDNSDSELVNKNISTIWSLTCILTMLIIVVAGAFYFFIDPLYNKSFSPNEIEMGKTVFLFAGGNLIFTFLNNTLNGVVLAYEKYVFEKFLTLIKLLARVVLILILLSFKTDIIIVAIVDFVLSVVGFLITLSYCRFKFQIKLNFKNFDKKVFKECLPLASAMLIQTIVNTSNGVVDKFLISLMMMPEDVSVYSISMMIFTMFSSIATIPVTMFLPGIAKEIKGGTNMQALTDKLIPACRLNTLITGLILFGFVLVGKNFIGLLYGNDFIDAWYYTLIVIIPMFFNMFNAVIINVLDIINKRHVRSFILLGTTTLNIFITIFGIKYFGMVGAAFGTAVALILQTIILNIYYSKFIGLKIGYLLKKSFCGIISSLTLSYLFVFPIVVNIKTNLISLLVGGILFLTLFFVIFMFLGANKDEKEFVNNVINKINKRNKRSY